MLFAKEHQFENLIGEFLETLKNKIVRDHYSELGFEAQGNEWILKVNAFAPKTTNITVNSN